MGIGFKEQGAGDWMQRVGCWALGQEAENPVLDREGRVLNVADVGLPDRVLGAGAHRGVQLFVFYFKTFVSRQKSHDKCLT